MGMAGGTHLRSGAVPYRRGRSEPLTATLRLERRVTISVCAARCGQGKLQLPHMALPLRCADRVSSVP